MIQHFLHHDLTALGQHHATYLYGNRPRQTLIREMLWQFLASLKTNFSDPMFVLPLKGVFFMLIINP